MSSEELTESDCITQLLRNTEDPEIACNLLIRGLCNDTVSC